MATMERRGGQTEQKVGLSPQEFKKASETVGRLIPQIRQVILDTSSSEILDRTGWRSYWRRQAEDCTRKWQWTGLNVGHLAVGQGKALRGGQGETLNLWTRHNPISKDNDPDVFQLDFTNSDASRSGLDLDLKDYGIPTLSLMIDKNDSIYFLKLSFDQRRITAVPKDIRGIALFFNGLDFSDNNGLLDLSTGDTIQVGEHAATPGKDKTQLKRPMDAVTWYMDQEYVEEKVSAIAKWIESFPTHISLTGELALIKTQAGQVLQTISALAQNPNLGKMWTKAEDDIAFKNSVSRGLTPARRPKSA